MSYPSGILSDTEVSPVYARSPESSHADDDLLAVFDSELESISEQLTHDVRLLSQIRYHRNSYAKVNSLPHEILQTIFRLAGRTSEGCSQTTEVLGISWACSHWRTLALGDPQLWRYIDLRSVDLARLFIGRSQPCTLVMDVHREWYCGAQADERRSTLCKENLGRVGALYFQPLSSTLPTWSLDQPAPELRELTVVNYYRYQNIYTSLFGDQTPQLRNLELMGCRLAWRSGMYRNLSKLKLEFYGLLPQPDKDKDLLALFRDSPNLESLELKIMDDKRAPWDPLSNFLLPTNLYSEMEHKEIDVPALRSLVLDLPSEYMLHILQSIALPGDMSHLDLTARADNDWLTSMLVSKRCLPMKLFHDLRELSVIHNYQYDIITCGIQGAGLRQNGERYDMSLTFLPLRNDDRPTQLEPIIGTIRNEHPMPYVEHLRFIESSRISNKARDAAAFDMVSLLGHCGTTLEQLTIHGCGGTLLDRIYRRSVEMVEEARSNPSSRPPLQKLISLAVSSMELPADDFAHLVSLCQLLSKHLRRVRIKDLACTARSKATAMALIESFQKLALSDTCWSDIGIWCEKEEQKYDIQAICAET